jgi:hypothetical protein
MSLDLVNGKFARIGARIKVRREALPRRLRIGIRHDLRGAYFDLALNAARAPVLRVLDVHPRARHLLLLADDAPLTPARRREGRQKFLFGHNGQWFVTPIPESAPATDVRSAVEWHRVELLSDRRARALSIVPSLD